MTAQLDAAVGIVAVDHVGIAVPDLDEAIDWYARTLGLDVPEASEDDLEAVYADLDLEVDDEAEDALGDDDLGDDGGPR